MRFHYYVGFEEVVFPAGAVPGDKVFFNITIVDDNLVGNNRLITSTLTVMPPGEFTTGGNVAATTLAVFSDDGMMMVCGCACVYAINVINSLPSPCTYILIFLLSC